MGRKNKKAEEVTYFFEDGVITPPNGALSKDCRDAIVSVGTKYIYIGSKGNWKYKWKELSNLILEDDDGSGDGSSMTFETEDDAMVDLSSCSRHNSYNNKNHNTWKEFHAFAMKRWDIILEKRERKRAEELAAAKKNSSKRNVRKKRIRPRNKVFGSKANRSTTYGPQPTMEWSDQEGDDILGDAETEIEKKEQKEENNVVDEDKEKEQNNATNDIVDDDDEEENTLSDLDDDAKIVTNEDDGNEDGDNDDVIINSEEEEEDDDDDKTLEAERISSDDNNMEEDEEEDANTNEEEDEEEETERKTNFFTPKRNPSKKKLSRIQSKLGEDGDSSDDDLFEKATTTMTTLPSTRKIVTPHSKEKVVSNNYFDSDDDNEEEKEEQQKTEVEEASQTKVSSFFAPRNSTMTKNESETNQQVSKKETTKITTKLTKQQVSKKETTKIVTKLTSTPPKSALTPIKQNNQEWLENTPPRQQRIVPTTPKKSLFFDKNKENNKENSKKGGPTSSFFSLKRAPPSTPMEDMDDFSDEENDMMYATELERKQKRRKFNQSSAFGTTISNNGGNQKTSSTADRALNFGNKMIKNKPHDLFIIKRREKTPMPSSSATTSTTAISRQPRGDIENNNIVNNEVSRRWKGLKNLGNTCYLNSSLQLLFTLPDFVTRLDTGCGDLCRSITSVSTALCDENNNKSSISPRCVKEAVDHVTDQFMGYEQRDAHEFLSDLIDRLHEEQASKQKEQESTKPLATDEFFRTDLNVCLKCNTCGYERTMQEMYRHLSIEVDRHKEENNDDENDNPPPKWKVEDGLKKFFAPQTVEVACEKCKVGKTATQTFSIKSCPKALILQLKRFVVKEKPCIQRAGQSQPESSGEMIISKNKDPVLIPERFQLSDMANFKDDTSNDVKYKLSGVVHHHGTTPSSGHYTADVIRRNKDEDEDEWVSFDDWQASPSQNLAKLLKNSTNQRTSYMLLYTAI